MNTQNLASLFEDLDREGTMDALLPYMNLEGEGIKGAAYIASYTITSSEEYSCVHVALRFITDLTHPITLTMEPKRFCTLQDIVDTLMPVALMGVEQGLSDDEGKDFLTKVGIHIAKQMILPTQAAGFFRLALMKE